EKSFKKKDVLKKISFEVGKGEVVGLLGENGAGKTTLLRLLSTLLTPSGGNLRVAGFDTVKQQEQVRKSIGVLF
ncbi:MAG TPA: ABC transporter ATP-binding protein, partial [Paenibacillaceae bacterium]|nr:ABC transporter ATP-binding protein [Paenibacillaceae bacterium]